MKEFTRKELHSLVWSQPLTKLAPDIGVSGVAIAKACALGTSSVAYQRLGQAVDRAWVAPDVTGGARHYHATSMKPKPSWAVSAGAKVTATIGGHVFHAGVA